MPPTTDPFKQWFQRSQVVNGCGDPLVVYHGTNQDFTRFEPGPEGIYFAERREAANHYAMGDGQTLEGLVIPVYLSLQNPLITTDEWLSNFARTHRKAVKAARTEGALGYSFKEAFVQSETWARLLVVAEAKKLGHDGMILPRDLLPLRCLDSAWSEQVAFVAFRAEQIKSALGNSGAYDPQNPHITDHRMQAAQNALDYLERLTSKVAPRV